jgi:hypothetical protein
MKVRRGLFPSYSYLPRLTLFDKPNTSTLLGLSLPYLLALSHRIGLPTQTNQTLQGKGVFNAKGGK